ncbi:MAG: hypothetical protein AB1714_26265 [Acidobacteriota bacterium]
MPPSEPDVRPVACPRERRVRRGFDRTDTSSIGDSAPAVAIRAVIVADTTLVPCVKRAVVASPRVRSALALPWFPALGLLVCLTSCGPQAPRFLNLPRDPRGLPGVQSVSGIVQIKSIQIRRAVEAMVAVRYPDRLRFEVMSASRTEAVLILNGNDAWVAFPRERLLFTTTVVELSRDLLALTVHSGEIGAFLTGRMSELSGWSAARTEYRRGDGLVIRAGLDASTGFASELELTDGNVRARLRWKQVEFDTDPADSAFEPPAEYAPCDREFVREKLGF